MSVPDPLPHVDSADGARRRLFFALRLGVTALVALLLLVRLVTAAVRGHLPELTAGRVLWLAAALVTTAAALVLSTLRWKVVLAALDRHVGTGRLLHHYAAGQFCSGVLPTTVGGDVLRVTRLGRDIDDLPTSFASVVLERLTGWLVLPAFVVAGMGINPGLARLGTASLVALVLALGTVSVLVALLWAAEHPSVGGRWRGTSRWRQLLGAVHLGVVTLRREPRCIAVIMGTAVAYGATLILAAFLASRALGMDLGPTAYITFIPAVLVAQVLPLSIAGLGLREGALVLFLHPLGVVDAEAILLGLLLYALSLVVSLAGAPSFAVGGRERDRYLVRT